MVDGLLALASAFLFWLSFPPADVGWAAWVAFVPLFIMVSRTSLKGAVLWGGLAGWLTFIGLLHWIRFVSGPGWIALAFYCGLYWPAGAFILTWL